MHFYHGHAGCTKAKIGLYGDRKSGTDTQIISSFPKDEKNDREKERENWIKHNRGYFPFVTEKEEQW